MRTSRGTLLAFLGVAACGGQARGPEGAKAPEFIATASLMDTSGARIGLASFSEEAGEGQLGVSVSGLSPGRHGMHIHETGTCTEPGFESAGGHFNPGMKKHGLENPEGPHAGDLPNLEVTADGSADTTLAIPASLLAGHENSVVGAEKRAFVIHAGPDDQRTDPSGDSGARVACGVIERR